MLCVWGGGRRNGRRRPGCRIKNKNPTQRCGEQYVPSGNQAWQGTIHHLWISLNYFPIEHSIYLDLYWISHCHVWLPEGIHGTFLLTLSGIIYHHVCQIGANMGSKRSVSDWRIVNFLQWQQKLQTRGLGFLLCNLAVLSCISRGCDPGGWRGFGQRVWWRDARCEEVQEPCFVPSEPREVEPFLGTTYGRGQNRESHAVDLWPPSSHVGTLGNLPPRIPDINGWDPREQWQVERLEKVVQRWEFLTHLMLCA